MLEIYLTAFRMTRL